LFESIDSILQVKTSQQWVDQVNAHWKTLLLDHAHCERKAADFAINLMKSYPDYPMLQEPLSKLIREEMRHFELCLKYLNMYDISFKPINPCGYAKSLHQILSHDRRDKLLDMLIVAAYIEARSCERFGLVSEVLKEEKLVKFYQRLYDAELRHFQGYLNFAFELYDEARVNQRIMEIGQVEAGFIDSSEAIFRFHSARPI
jgi:tRNA-(ms[2]io[6]A)-hydroxylase